MYEDSRYVCLQHLKAIQDIMRKDASVDGDAQRIGQLVWMLFLKIFDDRQQENELLDDAYASALPERLRWREWAANSNVHGRCFPRRRLRIYPRVIKQKMSRFFGNARRIRTGVIQPRSLPQPSAWLAPTARPAYARPRFHRFSGPKCHETLI
jgi:hypothetical protein